MSRANYVRKKFYSIYRDLNRQTYEAENSVLRDEVEGLRAEAARLCEIEEERRRANAPPPEPGSDEEEDEEESD